MPRKRWPFGDMDEPPFELAEGCAVCEECGGDGGGDYPARWSFSRDEPDYDWGWCGSCEGTGQVRLDGRPHKEIDGEPRQEHHSAPLIDWDIDEEIPF